MKVKGYLGMNVLIVICICVIAFLLGRNTNIEPTESKVIVNDVTPEQLDNIRKQIDRQINLTKKPHDDSCADCAHCEDNLDKVDIAQTPAGVNDVPKKAQQNILLPVSAETIRQRNQRYINEMESQPYAHLYIDTIDFYKKYPDFSFATASSEIIAERIAIASAFDDELTRLKADSDKRGTPEPMIFGPVADDTGGEE